MLSMVTIKNDVKLWMTEIKVVVYKETKLIFVLKQE